MKFGEINNKKLKSIAFDLDTNALKEYYTQGDWHNAYNDIKSFLSQQHFIHTQGSVYDSTTKFSDDELGDLIERMSKILTWLPQCVKSIRGYDQPVMIDYTQQLRDKILTQDLNLTSKIDKDLEKLKSKTQHNKINQSQKYISKSKNKGISRK